MNNYCMIQNSKTFAFSAENPTGVRAGGSQGGDCTKLRPTVTIPAGKTVTLVDAAGPGVIQHMWFTGYVGHHFIIRMYWDDQEYPSVEAPLSAFFGCAYDENFVDRDGKYPVLNSAMMLVAPGRGYNSYFEMPFHKRARITMENRGDKDENLYYIITGAYQEIPAEAGYFHATYRQEHPVQKGRTYTIVDGIEGRGQFVGVTLATGMNGNNTCWVEGEARMYLDDDPYPSIHYTGTEDYFGGSYGFGNDIIIKSYQTFSGLYTGMYAIYGDNREFYNGQQRFLLYHFHIADPIRFENKFRMTLDNMGWTGPRYDDYTSVAYWYQTLPSAPLMPLPTDAEMRRRPVADPVQEGCHHWLRFAGSRARAEPEGFRMSCYHRSVPAGNGGLAAREHAEDEKGLRDRGYGRRQAVYGRSSGAGGARRRCALRRRPSDGGP